MWYLLPWIHNSVNSTKHHVTVSDPNPTVCSVRFRLQSLVMAGLICTSTNIVYGAFDRHRCILGGRCLRIQQRRIKIDSTILSHLACSKCGSSWPQIQRIVPIAIWTNRYTFYLVTPIQYITLPQICPLLQLWNLFP
jgi:hypothetical protein